MCHYCGYSVPMSETCPSCKENAVRFSGFGTQKIEDELAALFPDARIVRMDTDSTAGKNSHEKLLESFAKGEFDMVVFDRKTLTCQIYEVKYSKEQVPEQYRHITNVEKCAMTSHRYGEITGRYVIYRGDSAEVEGIQYLNVEEYLKSL